ncbi:hypothetical protein N4T20_15030 [Flavobacterium sp. TR2]|uniref:PEP/pyruvate-binding domain-containing protein n=1 Tax=Flavobacterium sp. TR2 TaxID=2977321 RepID=UPI0021B11A1A|nr:PEP/pyruvate-binding domain-containing protein [Flavobacterium sp. TR2]UWY27035.1 hypothetical protein N4T20_15030 [Flavobacterium sp. TR2]
MEELILKFNEIGIYNINKVGRKNATLGEMYNNLASKGVRIPNGFAITAKAYKYFIEYNKLRSPLQELMSKLETAEFSNLTEIGSKARKLILEGRFPLDLETSIATAYNCLSNNKKREIVVVVRSSPSAENNFTDNFSGLHDSFLNIKGIVPLVYAVKCCFASLYTDRAIKHRQNKCFDHNKVFLSVGIQKMVRSDLGCSGTGFTLESESALPGMVHIAGTWGLGETITEGTVAPDEFIVLKNSLKNNKIAILQKKLGSKSKILVSNENASGINSTVMKITPRKCTERFVLEDQEIEYLARWAVIIEDYYQRPVDFEWAKDGLSGELYII